jgi:hypothetical protein
MPAQQWIRQVFTKKVFDYEWVFGGSRLIPDPEDPKKPPFYEANIGDVICICNMPSAMLDIPVKNPNSSPEMGGRVYEAFTERIPPLRTRVEVILESVPDKDDKGKDKPLSESQDQANPADSDDK